MLTGAGVERARDQLAELDIRRVVRHLRPDPCALSRRKSSAFHAGSASAIRQMITRLNTPLRREPADLVLDQREVQRDHDGDIRIARLGLDFCAGIERVEVHHRAAGLQDGVIHDDEIRAVRQAEPDIHALCHTQLLQPGGGAVGEGAELRIGPAPAQKIHRGPRAEAAHRVVEQLRRRRTLAISKPSAVGRAIGPSIRFPRVARQGTISVSTCRKR